MNHSTIDERARLLAAIAQETGKAASQSSALDITAIDHYPVREPTSGKRYSLLRITTRSGLVGWGESPHDPNADPKALQSGWVGRPANAYATIAPGTPFRAALDMACLDVLGKAANAPVYRVLGGPTRSKVRAYSSVQSDEFPVTVIDVPTPAFRNQGKAYQNRILDLVNAVPSDRDFVLHGNGALTPGDAASVATTVESKHPLWFDEPCAHSNLEAVRKVASESVVPLGFGAAIDDPGIFQALLREGLVDLVRPSIGIFGISGARRVAALAEPYYVAVAPRHDGGPVTTAAAIQLAASIPNFFIQHLPLPQAEEDRAMRRAIVSPYLESGKDGFLELTKSPGLGISVNEAALEKYHAS
jgi:galactonate dehydratase